MLRQIVRLSMTNNCDKYPCLPYDLFLTLNTSLLASRSHIFHFKLAEKANGGDAGN